MGKIDLAVLDRKIVTAYFKYKPCDVQIQVSQKGMEELVDLVMEENLFFLKSKCHGELTSLWGWPVIKLNIEEKYQIAVVPKEKDDD